MNLIEEFTSQFQCETPDFLPHELRERLEFISCLSNKQSRKVYLTADKETGEKAVLKIADKTSPDSVKREYDLISKLSHPSIPKALLFIKDDDGREYLLRSYAPGDTLDNLLERDGIFDTRRILDIIQKLCGILSYLHHQTPPIIYRDIKPQNIVLTPNGKISLIDFGISREENKDKDFDTVYIGSVAFAAPEMFGFTKSDSRTDIFTLGKLMIYLGTGNTELSHYAKTIESKELIRIIGKCTMLSPEKRYASVEKLSNTIGRVLNPPTRKEMLAVIITSVMVIAAGLFVFSWLSQPDVLPAVVKPITAGGEEYAAEVKLPVKITTTLNGKPFSECSVTVDNHHWFHPAENGMAELMVYAYDDYKVRAAYKNQTAAMPVSVTRDTPDLSVSLELSSLPAALEYLPVSLPHGKKGEVPLEIEKADSVTLSGQPEGITIEQREGKFYVIVDEKIENPGFYTIFLESTNEFGKADTVLSLNIEAPKTIIAIHSIEELNQIRNNLAGYYELAADLDLSGYGKWTPIGADDYPFTGTFDGKGFKIKGLTIDGAFTDAGLFGETKQAVIRNVILDNPDLRVVHVQNGGIAAIVGSLSGGFMENCAVFGGKINADIGFDSSAAGICGLNRGTIRNCFNSADIKIYTGGNKDYTDCAAGGICGTNNGYIIDSGNIGKITGISMAGGIAGFNDQGIITRCYNAAAIKSPSYNGIYPSGGIAQLGRGKTISYSCFEKGTAQVGATGGVLLGLVPVQKEDFKSLQALNKIFGLPASDTRFTFASLDSFYPIPAGIFAERLAPPVLPESGLEVKLAPINGVRYFYTLDGSDPHNATAEGVESVTLTLKQGEVIQVFSARAGMYDSETVEYRAK